MTYTPLDGPQGPDAYPSLRGRSVIVTGGGQGLGRSMALALVERGALVTINVARDAASMDETVVMAAGMPGEIAAIQADIRFPAECEKTVALALDRFGAIDGLVNNAARGVAWVRESTGGDETPFWEADGDRWAETMTTNVIGTFQMCAAATPHMIARGNGRIVNISTSDRSIVRERNTPYGPSKAALEAMTVAFARELSPHGVTANVLLPGGAADTRMATGVTGKPLYPREIMNANLLWLCADQSNGITGGRYIGSDWDVDLPMDEAAARARQPAHDLPAIV